MALCLSIFLEAIQRFVEPQIVSNPKLVLIVGCFGLLSNILGLFLFHEHGHSHGGGDHGHTHHAGDTLSAAEEGHGARYPTGDDEHTVEVADEGGNIADVLPENAIGGWPRTQGGSGELPREAPVEGLRAFSKSDEDNSTTVETTSPLSTVKSASGGQHRRHWRRSSRSKSRGFSSVEDMHIHPASFRNDIIAAGRLEDIDSATGTESEGEQAVVDEQEEPTEGSPLLGHTRSHSSVKRRRISGNAHNIAPRDRDDSWHAGHNHKRAKEEGKVGGHSHGDLNMRGVFLHVMGDALGNIGVIGSALIIWLTSYSWRYYSDPAISLLITVIILGSAIPLCKAASRILLQAVPAGINVDEIKEDINELPGILSCHHLHVWQLSDTKLVASLHVQVEFDFKGEGSARYMQLAKAVRTCLHDYGIHSSTIQPEFCLDGDHDHTVKGNPASSNWGLGATSDGGSMPKEPSKQVSRAASMRSDPDVCLLECEDACGSTSQCCAPITADDSPQSGHGHDH